MWKSLKFVVWERVKPLPDDKILALSKLKAFADDNFSVAQMVQIYSYRVENIVGKGGNASYHNVF